MLHVEGVDGGGGSAGRNLGRTSSLQTRLISLALIGGAVLVEVGLVAIFAVAHTDTPDELAALDVFESVALLARLGLVAIRLVTLAPIPVFGTGRRRTVIAPAVGVGLGGALTVIVATSATFAAGAVGDETNEVSHVSCRAV